MNLIRLVPSKGAKMNLIFNKKEIEYAGAPNLGDFLRAQGIAPKGVAVAVNGKVITRTAWDNTEISDGDKIMVITAVCGG